MTGKKEHDPKTDKPSIPPRHVPDAGALDKDDIKSVDLEPRSNGETDWQDEIPDEKRRKEG